MKKTRRTTPDHPHDQALTKERIDMEPLTVSNISNLPADINNILSDISKMVTGDISTLRVKAKTSGLYLGRLVQAYEMERRFRELLKRHGMEAHHA